MIRKEKTHKKDKNKKKINIFRSVGEGYAYLQAYLDDTILYSIKKLQENSKEQKDVDKNEKLHKKLLKKIGRGIGFSLGEAGAGFYEKYAELKKGENLAKTAIEEDIPRMRIKGKNMMTKMELMGVKKGDIQALKKLKEGIPLKERLKIKTKQIDEKMNVMGIEKGDIKSLKKLKSK